MSWGVQVVLMILGVGLALRKEIRLWCLVARVPTPFFVGLTLILQLPLAQTTSILIAESARRGRPDVSPAEVAAVRAKYQWLDMAIPAGAAVVAGVFLALGLKDPAPRPRPADAGDLFSGAAPPAESARPHRGPGC